MPSMSFLAITLSVACGLAYAASDYFRKAVPHTVSTPALLFFFLAGQLPLLGGWLYLETLNDTPRFSALTSSAYWRPGLIDAIASLMGNTMFIVAVRRSPIGLVVPLLALIPVFTLILGAAVLGEFPATRQILGILVTTTGIFAIYQPEDERFNPPAMWRRFRSEPGTLPMVICSLSWSAMAPLDKLALAEAGTALHALIQVSLLSVITAIWVMMQRNAQGQLCLWRGFAVRGAPAY